MIQSSRTPLSVLCQRSRRSTNSGVFRLTVTGGVFWEPESALTPSAFSQHLTFCRTATMAGQQSETGNLCDLRSSKRQDNECAGGDYRRDMSLVLMPHLRANGSTVAGKLTRGHLSGHQRRCQSATTNQRCQNDGFHVGHRRKSDRFYRIEATLRSVADECGRRRLAQPLTHRVR